MDSLQLTPDRPEPLRGGQIVWRLAAFLFVSGLCSLIYETVWLRELRLIFGASTRATAVVVACFVGGTGVGALWSGKRADKWARPLRAYAVLEAVVAASAAGTPILLAMARAAYIRLGGVHVLGPAGATLLRLAISATIFLVPTVAMGATLPATTRAVEQTVDRGRRSPALLYGANLLGAVVGCTLSTFVLLNRWGDLFTILGACSINALVALSAWRLVDKTPDLPVAQAPPSLVGKQRAISYVLIAAAAITGFVFCLMELVWYRVLNPLLGGTVFGFGLILAMALLGLGTGAVAYASRPRAHRPALSALAWTCMLEATFIAIPFALGDQIAVVAILLQPLGFASFKLQMVGASVITGMVVLLPAVVSGAQLPIVVGLLGEGDFRVGHDSGKAYAANAFGSAAGSLAGGFGLITLLSASGCWRLAVWLLLTLGAVAVGVELGVRRRGLALAPLAAAVAAVASIVSEGPSAAWRHSPIGARRVAIEQVRTPNAARAWENLRRRSIAWEVDGIESSVAIDKENGLAFVVNGKIDGSARTDAGTPVMLGLLGAMIVEHPARAMVIGLGTGETAGWLANVESMESVDVAELEPAMLEVARRASLVNCNALNNPKVHVQIGDARELLLTSRDQYNVIASEPSNPYRAGVASLFTEEYYRAAAAHLEPGGVFVQWLQGYEVGTTTVQSIYATLTSVFPDVSTWELSSRDIAFVAARRPLAVDLARLQSRMAEEPYLSATARAWRVTDLEGFLAHFVAGPEFARRVRGTVNTDDRNVIEFAMARTVGNAEAGFGVEDLRRAAVALHMHRPKLGDFGVDWNRVDEEVVDLAIANGGRPFYRAAPFAEGAHRMAAMNAFEQGDTRRVVEEWRAQPRQPVGPTQTVAIASALADLGDDEALSYAEALRAFSPAEFDAIVAHLRLRQGQSGDAVGALESLYARLRRTPWPMIQLVVMALNDTRTLLGRDGRLAARIYQALRDPFALDLYDEIRTQLAFAAAAQVSAAACVEALHVFEPNIPWQPEFLSTRLRCYRAVGDALVVRAQTDIEEWRALEPTPFGIDSPATNLDGLLK